MLKQTQTEPKKKIALYLKPGDYNLLAHYAEKEKRKISNAARFIIVQFLREYMKNDE